MEIFTEDNVKLDVEFIPIQEKVQVIPGRKSSAKYDVIFVASEIPALGYKTYFVQMMSQNSDQILEPIEVAIDQVALIAQPADYPGNCKFGKKFVKLSCHSGPEYIKKSRPKKLVKSNKSISRKKFFNQIPFFAISKMAKNQVLKWEKV